MIDMYVNTMYERMPNTLEPDPLYERMQYIDHIQNLLPYAPFNQAVESANAKKKPTKPKPKSEWNIVEKTVNKVGKKILGSS